MIVCDISPFYCERGGGIRTFHQVRLEWFARQARHRYVLVCPGPGFSVTHLGPSVTIVRAFGARLTRDADGYRMLVDYPRLISAIRDIRPDVLQGNDPWLSGPLALMMRHRWGMFAGPVTSFCHSNPIATYVRPRLMSLPGGTFAGERLSDWASAGFHRLQRCYAMTFVASDAMRRQLLQAGVTRVSKVDFGVEPELLALRRSRRPGGVTRLLYAGRLDDDKEFALVLDALPELLRRRDLHVSVIGTGKHRLRVALFSHPRFSYLGFVSDRAALRSIYAAHDVLLAPGRYETFGLSALEAMAAGLVVVGPAAGGTGELLAQAQSPLAFTPGAMDSFLERVGAAVESDRRELAERGRALAAAYGTWNESVARHVAMYEALTGDGDAEALSRTT